MDQDQQSKASSEEKSEEKNENESRASSEESENNKEPENLNPIFSASKTTEEDATICLQNIIRMAIQQQNYNKASKLEK